MNDFKNLFDKQIANQTKLVKNNTYNNINADEKLPTDNVSVFSYHVQQLISEIGEVLECDKRWKNIRNDKYIKEQKLDELADCFIVWMNLIIFSGFSSEEILSQINSKLDVVEKRIEKNKK